MKSSVNTIITASLLSLSASFANVAEAKQTSAPDTPFFAKIQGVPFYVDCKKDFAKGLPSENVLGRLVSHIEGVQNPRDENDNLFTMAEKDRQKYIDKKTAFMPKPMKASVMRHLKDEFDGFNAAENKSQFFMDSLKAHNGNDKYVYALQKICAP